MELSRSLLLMKSFSLYQVKILTKDFYTCSFQNPNNFKCYSIKTFITYLSYKWLSKVINFILNI